MIALSMLGLGLVMLLAAITVMNAVAVREPILQPVTGTFGFEPPLAKPEDTLGLNCHDHATLGDSQRVDLHRLCDVESLLDSLEAIHAVKTEVEIAGQDHFIVRWR